MSNTELGQSSLGFRRLIVVLGSERQYIGAFEADEEMIMQHYQNYLQWFNDHELEKDTFDFPKFADWLGDRGVKNVDVKLLWVGV